MKKILLLTVCLFFVAANTFSQQQMDPAEMAKRTTDWMKTELKLNDDQSAKVEKINLTIAQERVAMFEKANGDFESMRGEMEKLNAKTLAEFEKILSKEQLEEYQKQQAQRRQGGPR
jgi:hypothetical protein